MNIQINNERRNPELEKHIQDRLFSTIGRFSRRVDHIDVHVHDENQGSDRSEKTCSIDIKLNSRGLIHVGAKDKNIFAAVNEAARRAQRSLLKSMSLRKTRRHSRAAQFVEESLKNSEVN